MMKRLRRWGEGEARNIFYFRWVMWEKKTAKWYEKSESVTHLES